MSVGPVGRQPTLRDPRHATAFRFVRCTCEDGTAELVYAFDDGPELIERILFPQAPPLGADRQPAFDAALKLLHLIAGVSYYKAGVPSEIAVQGVALDAATAELLDAIYLHGLAEFAYQNKLDLRGKIRFPCARHPSEGLDPALPANGEKPDSSFRRTAEAGRRSEQRSWPEGRAADAASNDEQHFVDGFHPR